MLDQRKTCDSVSNADNDMVEDDIEPSWSSDDDDKDSQINNINLYDDLTINSHSPTIN